MQSFPEIENSKYSRSPIAPEKSLWQHSWPYLLLLALPVIALNLPNWNSTFNSDDWYILAAAADPARGALDLKFFEGYFRPVGLLTWQVGFWLFGVHARPFFVLGFLLHLADTWLIFAVGYKLTGSRLTALLAGLIFCTYFDGYEPVVWLASTFFDTQALFFMLLGLWLFLRLSPSLQHPDTAMPVPGSRFASLIRTVADTELANYATLILVVVCYALAVFSKEAGLFLLPVCLFYDIRTKNLLRRRVWQSLVLYGGMGLIAILFVQSHSRLISSNPGGGAIVQSVKFDNLPTFLLKVYGLPATALANNPLPQLLLWLAWLPVLPLVIYLGWLLSRFVSRKFATGKIWQNPEVNLILLGVIWTGATSFATLFLAADAPRYHYIPHVGAAFSYAGLLGCVVRAVQSLKLSDRTKMATLAALLYPVTMLSVAGMLAFGANRQDWDKADFLTRQLITAAQTAEAHGATGLALVDMPSQWQPADPTEAFVFLGGSAGLAVSLNTHFSNDHIKLYVTDAPGQQGYIASGTKIGETALADLNRHATIIKCIKSGAQDYRIEIIFQKL